MGTFTIPLNEVIEITGGTVDFSSGIAKMTGGDIGLNLYTIWNEGYRDTLNGKIIDHYWNREIGQESVPMFQMAMRRRMNEIMPLINQLYASTQLNFDPLSTIDMTTIASGDATQHVEASGENNTTSNTNSKSRTIQSDTPQTMLSGSEDYASGGVDANSQADATSDATELNTSDSVSNQTNQSTVKGFQGSAADLVIRYRESLLNIDVMVITELEMLFMQVWNNGDTYTNNEGWYY